MTAIRTLLPLGSVALLVAAQACSFSTFDHVDCVDHAACREAFGWGYQCGAEGFCESIVPPSRCETSFPTDFWDDPSMYADSIVLGMSYDHTYTADVQSMRLAFSQVNDQEGLGGKDFVLVECDNVEDSALDSLAQEDAAVQNSLWLAETMGVPAILGCDNSTSTEAAFVAVQDLGVMMMSPAASSPALTDLDGLESSEEDPGLLWRTVPPDSYQGEVIADWMINELQASDVLVIYEAGSYGLGLQEAFLDNFSGKGRSVETYTFSTVSERDECIARLGAGGFDQVLFIASNRDDIVSFLYAAAQLSIFQTDAKKKTEPPGIFLTDGAYYLDIFEEVAANQPTYTYLFDLVTGTHPYFDADSTVFSIYSTSYAAAYGGLDPGDAAYGALGFDAAWLTLYSTLWSWYQDGEVSGLGMARGMRHVSASDPVDIKPTSWSTVQAHFEEARAIDVTGASGNLDYDPSSGETTGHVEVWGLSDDSGTGWGFTSEQIY